MENRLQPWLNRLEALSLRERVLLLAGTPMLLLLLAQALVFGPLHKREQAARKEVVLKQAEHKALSEALAARPAVAVLPAAELLRKQRDELHGQLQAADAARSQLEAGIDWASVVHAAGPEAPGLSLMLLRTAAPEVVFNGAAARAAAAVAAPKTAAAAASAPTPPLPAAPLPVGDTVFRHRAELNLKGDVGPLLGYLQALQQSSTGGLYWDRLLLSAAAYPQASVQLSLYTLSNRAETPFSPR